MGETINLFINLNAFVRRETKTRWVAICPRLGVASQGRTEDAAKHSLREALEGWFESCVERGVLDAAMREASFRPLAAGEKAPHDAEHILVERSQTNKKEDDIRGNLFPIRIEVPAYQAAAFLSA